MSGKRGRYGGVPRQKDYRRPGYVCIWFYMKIPARTDINEERVWRHCENNSLLYACRIRYSASRGSVASNRSAWERCDVGQMDLEPGQSNRERGSCGMTRWNLDVAKWVM